MLCRKNTKLFIESAFYKNIYVHFSDSCEFGSMHYFALCGLGGILSCGITHTMVVPLDLVKCRIQVDPDKYKSVFNGFKVTIKEEGTRGLGKGWAPTFFGYSAQVQFLFDIATMHSCLIESLLL